VWIFDLCVGKVSVSDSSSRINLVLPQIGALPTADNVSGTARGVAWVPWPRLIAPVTIDWTVADNG